MKRNKDLELEPAVVAAAPAKQTCMTRKCGPPLLVFGGIIIGLVLSNAEERITMSAEYGGDGTNADPLLNRNASGHSAAPIRVLLVRHGQSDNNVVQSRVGADEARWLELREDDPALSTTGESQAELLAAFYAPVFDRSATRVRIFTSPFLRACQTAQPLFRRLRPGELARVTVYPDLGETGGCYTAHRDNATGRLARVAPGECMTAAQISRQFPGYETDPLPLAGPWYAGAYERGAVARARATRVAAWLQSEELQDDIGDDVMVIVSHGDFINLLIQELLDVGSAESRFPLPNSGTSLFEIHRRAVITRWIGRVGHLAPAENYIQSYFRSGSG